MHASLSEVEAGAKRLAQVVLGASHLVQAAVPSLLDPDNVVIQQWKGKLKQTLQEQAGFLCKQLAQCHGLTVARPSGAMYCLVSIDALNSRIKTDLEFAALLLEEENVFVLPGTAFGLPGYFRVVFCSSNEVLGEAAERIRSFCERHFAE